jgi:lysophospholipase L1-like esterase
VSQPDPLVVFGDSHTQGTGASRGNRAFAPVLASTLGLPLVQLGFGGTGFVFVGPRRGLRRGGVLGDFVDRVPVQRSLLVLQIPAHDRTKPVPEVRAALDALLDRVGPGPTLLVGPLWASNEREKLPALRAMAAEAAAARGLEHADADGWITPDLVGPDGAHFTDAGHAEIARRIAEKVRELHLLGDPVD